MNPATVEPPAQPVAPATAIESRFTALDPAALQASTGKVPLQAVVDKGVLWIGFPVAPAPRPSKEGKMLHIASPIGWVDTTLAFDGKAVRVSGTIGVKA